MPELTIDFDPAFVTINDSVQVGDTAYYCVQSGTDNHDLFNVQAANIVELGTIVEISESDVLTPRTRLVVMVPGWVAAAMPSSNSFILFSKNNVVNTSSPLGYFARARISNNSTVKSEIYSVACDVFESSK